MWRSALLLWLAVNFGAAGSDTPMPPNARAVAGVIGITEAIDELKRQEGAVPPGDIRRLTVRQRITEAVLEASLDADSAIAEIQVEESQIRSAEEYLSSRRDKAVALANIAGALIGSGVGVAATAMQFSNRTAIAGDVVGVAAGTASTALTIAAMRMQHGGQRQLGVAPNMLAAFFGAKPELHSDYPEDVWTYLNTAPVAGPVQGTWFEQLMREWVRQGRIRGDGSPADRKKIEFLTSSISNQTRLNLNELGDRGAMLAEVRARVSLMKRDLADLMRALRQYGW